MDLKAGCGLAATVIALTGCGGSESGGAEDAAQQGSQPREDRLSPAEAKYVERLDALCKEGDEISDQVGDEIGRLRRRLLPKAEMSARVVELLDESYVGSNAIRERIRKLDPPPSEERFHRRYNEESDRLMALNKRGREAIARGEDLFPFRSKAKRVTKRRHALVAEHGGFRYCG